MLHNISSQHTSGFVTSMKINDLQNAHIKGLNNDLVIKFNQIMLYLIIVILSHGALLSDENG